MAPLLCHFGFPFATKILPEEEKKNMHQIQTKAHFRLGLGRGVAETEEALVTDRVLASAKSPLSTR